jgi:hypothetical protein
MTTKTATTPKTATITLRAGGTTMRLLAQRRPDETAVTYVTTVDPDKKTTRGMTETHPTFDAARAALAGLAAKAEKLGWSRAVAGRGFVARPDAFTTLPAAPKATVVKK